MSEFSDKEFNAIAITDRLIEELGLETDLAKHCAKLAITNLVKLDEKQVDYGPECLLRHGKKGVVVRIDDKSARLSNLLDRAERPSVKESNFEPRLDSWLDLSNYGLIGAAMETGWPLGDPTPALSIAEQENPVTEDTHHPLD